MPASVRFFLTEFKWWHMEMARCNYWGEKTLRAITIRGVEPEVAEILKLIRSSGNKTGSHRREPVI